MLILTFLIDSSQWLSQKEYNRIRFTHEDIEIWKITDSDQRLHSYQMEFD